MPGLLVDDSPSEIISDRRLTASLASKGAYVLAAFALPAAGLTFAAPPEWRLHLFVLMISFPAHLGGFLYAYTKMTPHGWEYEGHTGEKGATGPLLPRPGVAHDPRFEMREGYMARSRRTLRIALAVLEAPSVAALAAVVLGYPATPMRWVVFIGFVLTAFLRPCLNNARRVAAAMAAPEAEAALAELFADDGDDE